MLSIRLFAACSCSCSLAWDGGGGGPGGFGGYFARWDAQWRGSKHIREMALLEVFLSHFRHETNRQPTAHLRCPTGGLAL
ncbi:hypothetical protein EJ03DRAFT_330629 [Teratosphaeria nubilosa]|uniref:Secreted protein n=1 Tax=Teratosphaeria nubilosa TaxID=161662 RepID=A0A6G1L0V9_9PEZI|nr:hypothetical protein EJ03DRAFT_330629 [Teratosphaeria nubilosa]